VKLTLTPVAPIGKRVAHGFACGGGHALTSWEENEYPPAPPEAEQFRVARLALDLGLRECARVLGVKPWELSDLESGRAVPTDGWGALFKALDDLGGPR
jgi:hypothetical protein